MFAEFYQTIAAASTLNAAPDQKFPGGIDANTTLNRIVEYDEVY